MRLMFALSGVAIAAWAVVVPYAKIRFHLSDGGLGEVLFLASIGGVSIMFLAGAVVAKWGSRACLVAMLAFMCILMPALAVVPKVFLFTALLFLYSASFGLLDVGLSTQGAVLESRAGRLCMSGFHACFSLGTLTVAFVASLLFKFGVTLEWFCGLCAVLILAGLTQSFRLLPRSCDSPPTGKNFVVPNHRAVILGLCCFAAFMCEGATTDWSTVFLHFYRHMPLDDAILGYAAFTVTTTLTRLSGDRLAVLLGQVRLMRLGVMVAVLGFGLAVSVPSGIAGIIGFGLVGFGSGNIVPLLFSAASRVPGMAAHHSVPVVVGIGYTGFLAGPVMIGLVSSHFGLGVAFAVDAVLLGASFFAARYISPSNV